MKHGRGLNILITIVVSFFAGIGLSYTTDIIKEVKMNQNKVKLTKKMEE